MLQLETGKESNFKIEEAEGALLLNGKKADYNIATLPNGMISLLFEGRSYTAILKSVDPVEKKITLSLNGQDFSFTVQEPIDLLLEQMGMGGMAAKKAESVKAPMPGKVLKVMATPGQEVQKGDGLLILEAMKMENVLKATQAATVKQVMIQEGAAVEKGALLIEME